MRLSFGCRSTPNIFNTLADAIEWIGKHEFNIEHLFHLLDDFLTVEESSHNPQAMIRLLDLFSNLNVPTAPGKVVGPVTCLEFLGIILDTVFLEARLPADKIARIKDLISLFQHKNKCTKRELLSIIGVFIFAARIILPGRAFLSHMIELSKTVNSLDHFIYLNKTFYHLAFISGTVEVSFLKNISLLPPIYCYTPTRLKQSNTAAILRVTSLGAIGHLTSY